MVHIKKTLNKVLKMISFILKVKEWKVTNKLIKELLCLVQNVVKKCGEFLERFIWGKASVRKCNEDFQVKQFKDKKNVSIEFLKNQLTTANSIKLCTY